MRPVDRGPNPRPNADDYPNYRDAFGALTNRLGWYCSYCERRLPTMLHVEHIQPKDPARYPHLVGRWENFLLACVNCNSTKGSQAVTLQGELLPDRDNTFAAFDYTADGRIEPSESLHGPVRLAAERVLRLVGLDKAINEVVDENGQLVLADRKSQRLQARLLAKRAKQNLQRQPGAAMLDQVIDTALENGHFSTWMDVFAEDPVVRRRLIRAFGHTATDCFDAATAPVSPRPGNGLPHGGKV